MSPLIMVAIVLWPWLQSCHCHHPLSWGCCIMASSSLCPSCGGSCISIFDVLLLSSLHHGCIVVLNALLSLVLELSLWSCCDLVTVTSSVHHEVCQLSCQTWWWHRDRVVHAPNKLLNSQMVGGDKAHVSASSCHHSCLCCHHIRWCRCGHAHIIVMFPLSLSSVRSHMFYLHVLLIVSWPLWHLCHTILVESQSSSCSHCNLPITCHIKVWVHGAHISIVVRSGYAGIAACFVVVVMCPSSSLPLTCQMTCRVQLHTHQHCVVVGSTSEPFSSLTAEGCRGDKQCVEHMEVADGDVGPLTHPWLRIHRSGALDEPLDSLMAQEGGWQTSHWACQWHRGTHGSWQQCC